MLQSISCKLTLKGQIEMANEPQSADDQRFKQITESNFENEFWISSATNQI